MGPKAFVRKGFAKRGGRGREEEEEGSPLSQMHEPTSPFRVRKGRGVKKDLR